MAKQGPGNSEAYQLYLKGRYEWNKRTRDGVSRATEYFEQAIGRDSSYALAYSGLAGAYVIQAFYGYSPAADVYPKALSAARKAIALDERSADAHAAYGWASLWYESNWPQSEREFERALVLNPNNAVAHNWHGTTVLTRGRYDEVIDESRRGAALDPLSPGISLGLTYMLMFAHRYDEAIEPFKKAIELEPGFAAAHRFLARVYRLKGMGDLAVAEAERAVELGDPLGDGVLALAYAGSGRKTEAAALLKTITEQAARSPARGVDVALVFAALGDKDRAFVWLEQASKDHDQWMPFLKVMPELDALRADPRFQDLVRRVGIP